MAKKGRWKAVLSARNVLVGLAAAVVIITSFFLDDYILLQMSGTKSSFLIGLMEWSSYFGSTIVVLFIMTSLFLWTERKREYLPVLWLTFAATIIAVYILKFAVARARPFDLVVRDLGIISYSMPSAHAAFSFCVLPLLDKEFPPLKWFWLLFAILVALSRIVLQAHFFSDVLVGAGLGFCVGWLLVKVEERYGVMKAWHLRTWK
ncbi:MAG: phosphatase PAP2 family protein [Nanoarchaeota archaeon]